MAIAIGFSIQAVVNILTQFKTLVEAKRLNTEYRTKIEQLKEENIRLEARIDYATSSAYIQQQARDLLGLGNRNDYWLIMPNEAGEVDLVPRENISNDKPPWKQWWELFTR